MSVYLMKSIKQIKKFSEEPQSILEIESQYYFPEELGKIYPRIREFIDSPFKTAKVEVNRDIRLETEEEDEIFSGKLFAMELKKHSKWECVISLRIISQAKQSDGVLYAYLGDTINGQLVAVQVDLFDDPE